MFLNTYVLPITEMVFVGLSCNCGFVASFRCLSPLPQLMTFDDAGTLKSVEDVADGLILNKVMTAV